MQHKLARMELSNSLTLFHHLPLFSSFSFSLSSSLNHLSEWLAASIIAVVVLWRHDPETVWVATGCLLNVGLSIVLKKIINQPRPFPPKRSDPGMPSCHAQVIFYTLAFVVVSMVDWPGVNQLTIIISGLALLCASYLAWLRVSEKYHTPAQVLVGASLGATFNPLWMWAWTSAVSSAYESIMWVRVLVTLGATTFLLVFWSLTRSKMLKNKSSSLGIESFMYTRVRLPTHRCNIDVV